MAHPPERSSFVNRFTRSLEKLCGRRIQEGVLVAVSGGPDSTALLRLFQLWRDALPEGGRSPHLWVGHVHHGIRGAEADRDAEFVTQVASECRLGLLLEKVSVPELARTTGRSLEWTAREVRYEIFRRWARERSLGIVATGHTADDQLETILYRVARGSGLRGLSGMPAQRPLQAGQGPGGPLLIRPLLDWSREEIVLFLGEMGQVYCEDSTNQDLSIPRNSLRNQILPLLKQRVHPGISASLARLSTLSREIWTDLQLLGREKWLELRIPERDGADGLAFVRETFVRLPSTLQDVLLRRALKLLSKRKGTTAPSLSFRKSREIRKRIPAEGSRSVDRVELGMGWILQLDGDILRVAREERASAGVDSSTSAVPDAGTPLPVPGQAVWNGWEFEIEILDSPPPLPLKHRLREVLDAGKLRSSPLFIRRRRPGERFHPLGAPGSKKLKEFLRECGIPPSQRDRTPLLMSGPDIVWVVGHRVSHSFRVTEDTRLWALVKAQPPGGGD